MGVGQQIQLQHHTDVPPAGNLIVAEDRALEFACHLARTVVVVQIHNRVEILRNQFFYNRFRIFRVIQMHFVNIGVRGHDFLVGFLGQKMQFHILHLVFNGPYYGGCQHDVTD